MKEFMLALAHGRDLPLSQITTALSAAPADKAVILAGEEHIFPPFDPWLVFDSLVKRKEDEPALILAADPADKKVAKSGISSSATANCTRRRIILPPCFMAEDSPPETRPESALYPAPT